LIKKQQLPERIKYIINKFVIIQISISTRSNITWKIKNGKGQNIYLIEFRLYLSTSLYLLKTEIDLIIIQFEFCFYQVFVLHVRRN